MEPAQSSGTRVHATRKLPEIRLENETLALLVLEGWVLSGVRSTLLLVTSGRWGLGLACATDQTAELRQLTPQSPMVLI